MTRSADAFGGTSRLAERGAVIGGDLTGDNLAFDLTIAGLIAACFVDREVPLTAGLDFAAAAALARSLEVDFDGDFDVRAESVSDLDVPDRDGGFVLGRAARALVGAFAGG